MFDDVDARAVLGNAKTKEELVELATDMNVLLVKHADVIESVLNEPRSLEVVSRYGIGVNNVDVEQLQNAG